ncbi:MAG: TPM domain-containing protein, partial [Lachnospiraceae bacterium]|nr:TPM domain-containing protein [Lachnospiraceae bacterium]
GYHRENGKQGDHRLARIVCLTLLMSLILCGYGSDQSGDQSGGQRVFDDADLLTETEEEKLQQDIETRIDKLSLDIVVVTAADARGKSAMAYADDFYDEHGFGYGDEYGPGILFLIDMDNREFWFSTAGQAIADFTDGEIYQMEEAVLSWMSNGYYYQACQEFLDQVDTYAHNEEVAQNGYYDKDTDTFVEYTYEELQAARRKAAMARILSPGGILSRLAIAMVIGAVAVLILCVNVNRTKIPGGRVYMKPGGEYIRQRYDHKTNTTVTKRHIPRNNNTGGTRSSGGSSRGHSTVHRSSGGRSHGGGGRKF